MEELKQYDLVILSDIGANTLLLPGATFNRSEKMPNRCNLIRDYVNDGGALLMVGGYLTSPAWMQRANGMTQPYRRFFQSRF